jgi:hypothetical protein
LALAFDFTNSNLSKRHEIGVKKDKVINHPPNWVDGYSLKWDDILRGIQENKKQGV